jgi:uncharacterized protein
MGEEVSINFVELKEMDLNGFTLIEGFPGMGLVGTISAKYIVDRLKFEEIGHIDANIFIPIIRIHKGYPIFPSRIYASKKHKLVVIISEQIIPRFYTEKFAKDIVKWVKSKGIKKVISLAGIHTDNPQSDQVYGIVSNAQAKKELEKHNIELIDEGITTGITALILLELRKTNIPAFSILGNVNLQADYKAAATLIKTLNEILGLNIKVELLLKEARETEQELLKQLEELKKADTKVQKFEDQTPMYT